MILFLILLNQSWSSELFSGTWEGYIVNYTQSSGLLRLFNSTKEEKIFICLFDGKWKTNEVICLNCSYSKTSYYRSYYLSSSSFHTKSSEVFTSITGELRITSDLQAFGRISSVPSYLSFKLTADFQTETELFYKSYIFLAIFALLKSADFILCRLLRNICEDRNIAKRLSISSLILSSTVDIFYLLWAFDLSGRLEISIISFLVMIFVSTVLVREKSQLFNRAVRAQALSRRRHGFGTYMFLAILYISTLNSLYYLNVVASNLVYVPQIVKNFKVKIVINKYIIGFMLSQLAITLSVTLWEHNFLLWEPELGLSFVVIVLVTCQIWVIYKYSERELDLEERNEEAPLLAEFDINVVDDLSEIMPASTCSICLCQLGSSDVVRTACEHWFHYQCVVGWLRINSICPVCRNDVEVLFRRPDILCNK